MPPQTIDITQGTQSSSKAEKKAYEIRDGIKGRTDVQLCSQILWRKTEIKPYISSCHSMYLMYMYVMIVISFDHKAY